MLLQPSQAPSNPTINIDPYRLFTQDQVTLVVAVHWKTISNYSSLSAIHFPFNCCISYIELFVRPWFITIIECDMRPIPARCYLLGCTASNFRKLNKSHHCLGKAWRSAMSWKKQMGYCFEDDKWIPLIIIDYGVRFWWSPAGGLTLEISISPARDKRCLRHHYQLLWR